MPSKSDTTDDSITSAKDYMKLVAGVSVLLPSGSIFRVRVLTMKEYLDICNELMKEFKGRIKPEAILSVGTNAENPDVLMSYSKKALPICVIEPKVSAEPGVKDAVPVESIPPLDMLRLNMLSITASKGVRSLLASFLPGESPPEELERIRDVAKAVA